MAEKPGLIPLSSPEADREHLRRLRLGPFLPFEDSIAQVRALLSDRDVYKTDPEWSYHEYRDRLHDQALTFIKSKSLKAEWLRENPTKFLAHIMALSAHDISFASKLVIHFQLFGGTILELGTEYHHQTFLPRVNTLEIFGGFAMTEMGHGSNVRQIETTATWDSLTQEFVINSPTPTSTKFWIGNLAKFGNYCVVFAQLIIKKENKGVHAFVVPLRSIPEHTVFPNIEIGDCGLKIGWNGIDNAWIRFNNYRIPRLNLLNRLADVLPDGTYVCHLQKPSQLFNVTLSQLMVGRLIYVLGPVMALNTGVRTVFRYGCARRQFGPPDGQEIAVIEYQSFQRKLMPILATTVALDITKNELVRLLCDAFQDDQKRNDFHAIISGIKALSTEYCIKATNDFRVLCGGNGFSAYNRIGELRNELDVFQTAEGDGTVLRQQLARYLLFNYSQQMSGFGAMFKHAGAEIGTTIFEKNLLITRNTSRDHLTSRSFLLSSFRFRAQKLLNKIAMKMRQMKEARAAPFDIWNSCLHEILHLSDAYSHLYILERLMDAISKCNHAENKAKLVLLSSLYGLHSIEQDMGFFRNTEYVSATKGEAISVLVTDLCKELCAVAADFIESADVPESFAVPIGMKDGDYVRHMMTAVQNKNFRASL